MCAQRITILRVRFRVAIDSFALANGLQTSPSFGGGQLRRPTFSAFFVAFVSFLRSSRRLLLGS